MEQFFEEDLNDEHRCDECNELCDTITFIRKNVLCYSCAFPYLMDKSEISMNLTDFNNHLEKVETLLYKLSSENRVSVKRFLPLLLVFMQNWKSGVGLYEIGTLRILSYDWRIDNIDLIKVQKVVTILRKMRDELKLNMKKLC